MTTFQSVDLREDIQQNIGFLGFTEMTAIQALALPIALEGKDMIGQAKTGTGKTLTFAVPIIEKVNPEEKRVQALVLTPTRELAMQVSNEFEKLAGSLVDVALCYGGASMDTQVKKIRSGAQIVVGTPGRIMDHMRRGTLKLDNIRMLVLDEADRMLDMGFIKDVEWIIQKTPNNRQTMLFSATMPDEIRRLAEKHLREPEMVSASSDEDELTVGDVKQYYVEVDQKKKMDAFFKVARQEKPAKALIFCKTKRWVESLYKILKQRKFSADRIHGDMSQSAREKAIEKLRKGTVEYLVCTDVAARGLDIDDITHVFNYDLPQEPLTYVHRIGRTARAGKEGTAVSFVNTGQTRDLWLIEHEARTKITQLNLN
ncbi:MAG: DEAD/DEAH box helicase [Candidatus Altiarchaeota archaeon]